MSELTLAEYDQINNTVQRRMLLLMERFDEDNQSMAKALGMSEECFKQKMGIRQPFTAPEIVAAAARLGVTTDYLLGVD